MRCRNLVAAAVLAGAWLVLGSGCARQGPVPGPPAVPSSIASRKPEAGPSPMARTAVGLPEIRRVVARAGESFPGQAGMVYYDLEARQGAWFGENQIFEAASLVKLPILVELYRRAGAEGLDLSEELEFREEYRVGGSGVLKDREAGSRWPLSELARLMIGESDNAATDMLLDRLGPASIEAAMRRLGLEHTTVRRHVFDFDALDRGEDNLISPVDVLRLLRGIADETLPGSTAMERVLSGQKRADMIPAGLPDGVPVAHKTGELNGVLHDAGLVEAPGGTYVLILMGQGFADQEEAVARWAEVSRDIWAAREASASGIPPQACPCPISRAEQVSWFPLHWWRGRPESNPETAVAA